MTVEKNSNEAQTFFKGKLTITCPPSNSVNLANMSSGRGSITIKGSGNVVDFVDECLFNGSINIQGDNNRVLIGSNCAIRGQILVKGSNQTVSVGERTTFQSVYILCQESCNVTIGRWCMFSRAIEIRTTDAHSVIELGSGLRLNKPASIMIGDHVWVSVGAMISKGVTIPDDSIVGAQSFVNNSFTEKNTVIAGMPAKVVKRGVTWNRNRKDKFTEEEVNVWRVKSPLMVDSEINDEE